MSKRIKIKEKSIDKTKKLGAGQYSVVHPYEDNSIVKCYKVQGFARYSIVQEKIVLACNIEHLNITIVKTEGYDVQLVNDSTWNVFIKMKRMKKSLQTIIQTFKENKTAIDPNRNIRWFYSLTCDLELLEDNNLSHQDLKPSNIFLDDNDNPILSDFGPGWPVDDIIGPARLYTAPEKFQTKENLETGDLIKADVWSLGIIIMELCVLNMRTILPSQSVRENESFIKENLFLVKNSGYDIRVVHLLSEMLKIDSEIRPTFKEIKTRIQDNRILELIVENKIQKVQKIKEKRTFENEIFGMNILEEIDDEKLSDSDLEILRSRFADVHFKYETVDKHTFSHTDENLKANIESLKLDSDGEHNVMKEEKSAEKAENEPSFAEEDGKYVRSAVESIHVEMKENSLIQNKSNEVSPILKINQEFSHSNWLYKSNKKEINSNDFDVNKNEDRSSD